MNQRLTVRMFWIAILLSSQGLFAGVYCTDSVLPTLTEVEALLEFKSNYLAKASRQVLHSWNSGNISGVCTSWLGVTCTPSGHHIQTLNLSFLGLEGSLAPHLGNLSFLTSLNLSYNYLTGSIPRQLMGCASLEVLSLDSNRLSEVGSLSLGSLPSLRLFDLSNNTISGILPSALFKNISTSLLGLALSQNLLTGSIPPDLGLQLPSLQGLFLAANSLTGAIPSSLGNCTSLVYLKLGFNKLTGSIPAELGLMSYLTILFLYSNNLSGTIFTGIGNCTSLENVEVGSNNLSGVLPKELGRLYNLRWLLFYENNLTGSIPSSLGNCTKLQRLDLYENQLTGVVPATFFTLYHLQWLQVSYNYLSGAPLQHLGFSNSTDLVMLEMQHSSFSGSISSAAFSGLIQLRVLDLSVNHFTGHIPWDALTSSTAGLFYLDLSHNQLSGPGIPNSLAKMSGLQNLNLESNFLEGEIPESTNFSNLHLLQLSLASNRFTGFLPSSLAPALFSLQFVLDISNNNFAGSVPGWLNSIIQVRDIDFSNNEFTGSIPDLGNCAGLVFLNLSENHLSGNLPVQLGNLVYLQFLDLSHNHLSGKLPSFIGLKLRNLQLLNVSYNNFTGPIPTSVGVFKNLNASSFQGNPGLCGPLLKKECIVPSTQAKLQKHHGPVQLSNWRGRALLAGGLILFVLFMGMLILVTWRRYGLLKSKEVILTGSLAEPYHYTAKVLLEATQGYAEDNMLGQGGLSVVHKGVLSDGKIVAIKRLRGIYDDAQEALLREMRILGKLRHRNLVQVLGCVLNLDVKALVLEYMENGSLKDHLDILHNDSSHIRGPSKVTQVINRPGYWDMVRRVAFGIAQALTYLHYEFGESIIHGDVKPGNILFDFDFVPHLADFGLAKLIMRGAESVSLSSTHNLKGSIGYMAPEYAYATRVTTKVDVYSYGVVLLQMVTGRSPMEVAGPSGITLHDWVESKLATLAAEAGRGCAKWEKAALFQVLHKDLAGNASSQNQNLQGVQGLLRIALACSAHNPDNRPTMSEVLAYLTGSL